MKQDAKKYGEGDVTKVHIERCGDAEQNKHDSDLRLEVSGETTARNGHGQVRKQPTKITHSNITKATQSVEVEKHWGEGGEKNKIIKIKINHHITSS